MKTITPNISKSQKIITKLLLLIFLVESCNTPLSIHPQIQRAPNPPSDYHATLASPHTSTSLTTLEIASINEDSSAKEQTRTIDSEAKPLAYTYNRHSDLDATMAHLLKGQVCIAQDGYQINFENNEKGALQAIVEQHYPGGFTRQTLPVVIEPGFRCSEAAVKAPAWQKEYIHIMKGGVYLGHLGLSGGGKEKKEKGLEFETDEKTEEKEEGKYIIENLQGFIEEATNNAEKAKDKEIVLVLGNTGAGKSTIINYLLGSELQRESNDLGDIIAVPKDAEKYWAKIGHSLTSETFLPSVYSSDHSPFTYCDCPGFNDTRTEEERLKTTIATQLIVNCAQHIKGITVVIDVQDLIHSKGSSMRALSLTLSQLLKENIQPNSILFVFNNKLPSGLGIEKDLENTHKRIDALRKIEQEKLEKIAKQIKNSNNEEYENTRQIVSMLQMISDNKNNTLQIDLFDQLESKNTIEGILSCLQATPKNCFDFSEYDDIRRKFNTQLAEVVSELTDQLVPFVHAHESIIFNNEKIESCEERIQFYQAQIERLNAQQVLPNENKIQELQRDIVAYDQKIQKLEEKKAVSQGKLANLNKEKAELDTDEEVRYWKYKNSTTSPYLIEYSGPPFTRREISKAWGLTSQSCYQVDIKDEYINKAQGLYKAKYTPRNLLPYQPEKFSIYIYVKKKDIPKNKELIMLINKDLEQEQKMLEQYNQDSEEAQRSRKNTQDLINCYAADVQKYRRQVTDRKQHLEDELKRIQREKETIISQNINQEEIKKKAEQYLDKNSNLLTDVYRLASQGIGNESTAIGELKKYYQNYQTIIKQNVNYMPLLLELEFPDNLCCPIAGHKFIDPIITACGHTFNHPNLLSWLDRQKNCPTCRKPVSEYDLISNLAIREAVEKFETERRKEKIEQYRNTPSRTRVRTF